MAVGGHTHPATSNPKEDSSPTSDSSVICPSAAEKKQPSPLRGSGEGLMKLRVKEVS
jgi:hypothetical protein